MRRQGMIWQGAAGWEAVRFSNPLQGRFKPSYMTVGFGPKRQLILLAANDRFEPNAVRAFSAIPDFNAPIAFD